MPRLSDRQILIADLKAVLMAAQNQRGKRNDVINGELEWVTFERRTMHDAVNLRRSRLDLPPVSLGQIEAVESQACGHYDYTAKFAIGCAELVDHSAPVPPTHTTTTEEQP